jgi:hypothetical protein
MKVAISLLFLVIAGLILVYLKRKHISNKIIVPLLFLVLGITASQISYKSFADFVEDLRSEIIGMFIEVGIIYLLVDWSLEVERERERKRKETHNYGFFLKDELGKLLNELERRYLNLYENAQELDMTPRTIRKLMIKNQIRWEAFTSSSNPDSYDNLFRNFAAKEIEHLMLFYRDVMPEELLNQILKLESILKSNPEVENIDSIDEKEKDLITKTLGEIGSRLFRMRMIIDRLENEYTKDMEKFVEGLYQASERNQKIYNMKMEIKNFFKSLISRRKDEDKDISIDV